MKMKIEKVKLNEQKLFLLHLQKFVWVHEISVLKLQPTQPPILLAPSQFPVDNRKRKLDLISEHESYDED